MKKILIIGGTRFVGKKLVQELMGKGNYQVTLANRHGTKDFGTSVRHVFFDRKKPETFKNLNHEENDVVVDMICYSGDDAANIKGYLNCGRYVEISSSVVYGWGKDHDEEDFRAEEYDAVHGSIEELGQRFGYRQAYMLGKMSAEAIIAQQFPTPSLRVRFPLILGLGDHTGRIEHYARSILDGRALYVDNLMSVFSVVEASHAAGYLADLIESNVSCNVLNIADAGSISMIEIIRRIEKLLNKQAEYAADGESGGYNGYYTNTFDLNRMIHFLGNPESVDDYLDGLLQRMTNTVILGGHF